MKISHNGIALLVLATLTSCGGGGGSASGPITSTLSFPLQSGLARSVLTGSTTNYNISGSCHGMASIVDALPITAIFEGNAVQSALTTINVQYTDCTPLISSSTTTDFYDSNLIPLGSISGSDYGLFETPPTIPVEVKVGDNGTIGSETLYADSSKAVKVGREVISYVVEPDTANSAIINLINRSYDSNGILTFTEQDRYRIIADGTLSPISSDLQESNGSTMHLLLTLVPPQVRKLDISAQYTPGPLSAPTGLPNFQKTVIADFNGDGRNDIATFTSSTINGSDLVVMYQAQDGTFTTFVSFNSFNDLGLNSINDIAAGDLNGDGRIDLAVFGNPIAQPINSGPPLVVLYQDSAGNFGSPVSVTVFSDPLAIGGRLAIGDMNADGRNDVVVGGNPMMVVLQGSDGSLGTGTGSIFSLSTYSTFSGELHIADMDADGDNDLVFQDGNKSIGILRQTSPGVFGGSVEHYQVVTSYWNSFNTFEVGDVNGDGKNDVVALDPGNGGYLNIFLQNSSGTLDVPQLVTITSSPLYGIEIADINKDGLNDIMGDVVDPGYPTGVGQIHVFYQRSDHTFQNSTAYYFPTSAGGGSSVNQALSIGDVDGDGWPDAVVSWLDEGIFVLSNKPL
jgi:hypothetical protein